MSFVIDPKLKCVSKTVDSVTFEAFEGPEMWLELGGVDLSKFEVGKTYDFAITEV